MDFDGIPSEAVAFFSDLAADNSKAFWARNRDTYETVVRQPFVALLDALPPEYGPWRVYRPHRDVRFAKDKSPYKTFIGAVSQTPGATGHYVQVSRYGLLASSGCAVMAPDQLERFRTAVDDERSGPQLDRVLADLAAAGWSVRSGYPEPLKGAPKGYRRDHPRIERLRWKGVECAANFRVPDWLPTPEARDRVLGAWTAAAPLHAWLDQHVGPTTRSPEESWGRGSRRRAG